MGDFMTKGALGTYEPDVCRVDKLVVLEVHIEVGQIYIYIYIYSSRNLTTCMYYRIKKVSNCT